MSLAPAATTLPPASDPKALRSAIQAFVRCRGAQQRVSPMASRSHKMLEASNAVAVVDRDDAARVSPDRLKEGAGSNVVILERGDALLAAGGLILQAVNLMNLGAVNSPERAHTPASLLEAIGRALDTRPTRTAEAIDLDAAAKVASLSQRQRQVLHGVIDGKPNKIIAHELGISIRTVETYRAQCLMKLGARGTAEAVRLALAAGVL